MQYERAAARARRLFRELDREAEPRQWELAELLAGMKATGPTWRQLAADVGRPQSTVRVYVAAWEEHGATGPALRPKWSDAFTLALAGPDKRRAIEVIAEETGKSPTAVERGHRDRVREVQQALKDPQVAREVLGDSRTRSAALEAAELAAREATRRASGPGPLRGQPRRIPEYDGLFHEANDSLLKAAIACKRALEQVQAVPPSDNGRDQLLGRLDYLHELEEGIRSVILGGGVTDEALAALLGGES